MIAQMEEALASIKREHEEVFDLSYHLYVMSETDYADSGTTIFEELVSKVISHLKAEEDLLVKIGYPKVNEHKLAHAEVLSKLERVNILVKDSVMYFVNRIIKHVMDEDKEFNEWNKGRQHENFNG